MQRILIWTFVLTISHIAPSYGDGELEGRLASTLPTNARWALSVVDMETGKEILNIVSPSPEAGRKGDNITPHPSPLPQGERGHNEGMVPGSLVKLFTAGAAYEYMAGDKADKDLFDMTTTIAYEGLVSGRTLIGDLYLKGGGNPFLSETDLVTAASAVRALGIDTVKGRVVADDTLFDTSGMERTRRGPAYAPTSALGVDLHTAVLYVTPTKAGKAPEVRIEPYYDEARFAVSARTVKGGKKGDAGTLKITPIGWASFKVEGDLPASAGVIRKRVALKSPALYAASLFKTLLKREGVAVTGGVARGKTPGDAVTVHFINGPSMKGLIRDMNVESLNVVADNLFLLTGKARYGAPGTKEKGARAVRELLDGLGLGDEGAVVADGSGLSTENRVGASFMARYLHEVSKKGWYEDFRKSMARAGEGTTASFDFKDNRFRVKTGVLEDVFAVAGYGTDARDREVAFAYMINVPGAGLVGARSTGAEEVLQYIGTGSIR